MKKTIVAASMLCAILATGIAHAQTDKKAKAPKANAVQTTTQQVKTKVVRVPKSKIHNDKQHPGVVKENTTSHKAEVKK